MLSFLTYLNTGKLAKGAVLKAICAGFEETTEPAVCLSGGKFVLLYFLDLVCCHLGVQCGLELPRENRVNLCCGMSSSATITEG